MCSVPVTLKMAGQVPEKADDNSSCCQQDDFKEDWRYNHLVLETIFKNLNVEDLKSVSLVCSSWCWASAKFLSAKSVVYFLEFPSRSIETFLKIQGDCRVWEGPVRLKRFQFLSERRIRLLMNPLAGFLGEQMTELTITRGQAPDVNLLMPRLCQNLPNLKSLELRCSYCGLGDQHLTQNPEGWRTSKLEAEDSELGLVHTKLQVLQIDVSQYCGIKWDFLQVLVALRTLSIRLLDYDYDQEPIVVHKIQEVTSSLKSRVSPVAFHSLEFQMPKPSRSTSTAVNDLLHLLKPSTYFLNLINSRENRSQLAVQDVVELPPSVVDFKLELAICSPEALGASGIGQAYEAIVKGIHKGRRLGFLFRLNLMYDIGINSNLSFRFIEIDTGRAEALHLRIGSNAGIMKADQMLLDWIQKLLSVVHPRHNHLYLFRSNSETIRQVADWRMLLLKNDASEIACSLKFGELLWHKLGGSEEVKSNRELEPLKLQFWDSGQYKNPFPRGHCTRFDFDIEGPGYTFLFCPAEADVAL